MLYARYSDKVYAKCLYMLKDEVRAQDLAQEIFLKVYLYLPKFVAKSSFSTWLYSITYNQCIDAIRKAKKERSIFVITAEFTKEFFTTESDQDIYKELKLDQLEDIINRLPIKDKALILMKYKQEMSVRDIAEALGKTESAVKMSLKRAKDKARANYILKYS